MLPLVILGYVAPKDDVDLLVNIRERLGIAPLLLRWRVLVSSRRWWRKHMEWSALDDHVRNIP